LTISVLVATHVGAASAEKSPPPAETTPDVPEITPGPTLTLDQALQEAADQNLTLAATRLEIEKAEASLSMAWGAVFPQLSGKIELVHHDHEDTFNFGESMGPLMEQLGLPDTADTGGGESVIVPWNDLKGSLQVGLPLVHLPSWYGIKLAKKAVPLARFSYETMLRYQLFAVSRAYYLALMTRELIDLHLATIESAGHHLEVAKAKLDAGAGLRIDVIRAETELEAARQELVSANLAFDKARDAIAHLTGRDDLPLPVETSELELPSGPHESLIENALKARPDIKAKRLQVELARIERDSVWMQFLPTLSAAWQGSYQFTEPGDLGSTDRSRWIAIFTLSIPLYDQMRYGNLDLKRAQIRQTTIQQQELVRNISLEVRNARRDYLTSLTSVKIAERRAVLSEEALTLAEAAFEAGTGSSLDVTESRRTTSSANVDLASKRLQSQLALLKLLDAIGADLTETTK
jgi:outer membrane protein TolC